MTRSWSSIDLVIDETPDGLVITQGAQSYLARQWTLSETVCNTIDLAIQHGLTCLIRDNHPQPGNRLPDGVEYVGFSAGPSERWVFVLDQFSTSGGGARDLPIQVTFEQHHFEQLWDGGIWMKRERSGGQNIFVKLDELATALNAVGFAPCHIPGT